MCGLCKRFPFDTSFLTGGGAQIRPHPAVAMALILTVDNGWSRTVAGRSVQWSLLLSLRLFPLRVWRSRFLRPLRRCAKKRKREREKLIKTCAKIFTRQLLPQANCAASWNFWQCPFFFFSWPRQTCHCQASQGDRRRGQEQGACLSTQTSAQLSASLLNCGCFFFIFFYFHFHFYCCFCCQLERWFGSMHSLPAN